jgi:hypothetical protein
MITPIEVTPAYVPGQIKSVRVPARARKQLVFKLTDVDGRPVNLQAEVQNPPAAAPDFSPEAAATGLNVEIWLKAKAGDLQGGQNLTVKGEILSEPGFVSFQLTEPNTKKSGIYEATIGRFVSGDHLVDTWPVFIIVEPNAFEQLNSGSGPLTIPEIRLGMYDLHSGTDGAPFSNLLDDTEFQDTDIIFAMRQVVMKWNETPPPVAYYTPANFPYRYWWIIGTCAYLLQMSASRYRRNRLAYSAGGVSIDDQTKSQEYEEISRFKMQQFEEWMMREKVRINMERAWSVGI